MTTDNRTNEPTEVLARIEKFLAGVHGLSEMNVVRGLRKVIAGEETTFTHEVRQRAAGVTPVLPSSGIDEDALAEVIEAEIDKLRHETRLYPDIYKAEVARAVAEWLRTHGLSYEDAPCEEQIQIFDQIDMPEYNQSANSGRGDWGLRNVSDGTVMTHPTDIVRCVEHGAMNSVSPNRAIWRCLMCGRSAYRDIAGDAALVAAAAERAGR